MSLLSSFLISFQTDAADAAKDTDELDKKLKDTKKSAEGAAKGANEADKSYSNLGGTFGNVAKSAAGLLGGLFALSAIKDNIIDAAHLTDTMGKLAQTYDINITKMDAWGAAAERNGGSAQAFQGTIVGLKSQLSDIQFGGGQEVIKTLGMMGVSAFDASGKIKSTFDILEDVSGAFEGLNSGQQIALGKRLGLDQGTLLTLQQGKESVRQLVEQQEKLGSANHTSYLAAANFDDAMDNMGRSFQSLWQSANATILPMFTGIIKGVTSVVNFMRDHEDFAKAFFITIGTAITAVALPAIISLVSAVGAAASPFIAIGAAIAAVGAAVALLYDDVKHYLGGQKSLIGDLAKKYDWFGKLLDATFKGAKFIFTEFSKFFGEMSDNLTPAIDSLGSVFSKVFSGISEVFKLLGIDMNDVVDFIISIFSNLGDAISKTLGFIASPIEKTKELYEDVKSKFGFGDDDDDEEESGSSVGGRLKSFFGFGEDDSDEIINNTKKGLSMINSYDANPLNSAGSSSTTNTRATYNNNNFNMSNSITAGGVQPDQVKSMFSDEFMKQMAVALGMTNDGVDY